jgi:hypothetical protein
VHVQRDGRALFGWQSTKRCPESYKCRRLSRPSVTRIDPTDLRRLIYQAREPRAAPFADAYSLARDDPIEPGAHSILLAQARPLAPSLLKTNLNRVCSVACIAANESRQTQQPVVMSGDKGLERDV